MNKIIYNGVEYLTDSDNKIIYNESEETSTDKKDKIIYNGKEYISSNTQTNERGDINGN